jgi:hypothetical protein
MQRHDGGHYDIDWFMPENRRSFGRQDAKEGSTQAAVVFSNLFPSDVQTIGEGEDRHSIFEVEALCRRLRDVLQNLFTQTTYLGPLREEPARRYIYEDDILEIGSKGENAAYIYLSERETSLRDQYFYDQGEEKFYPESTVSLGDAVQRWMSFMGIDAFQVSTPNGAGIRQRQAEAGRSRWLAVRHVE